MDQEAKERLYAICSWVETYSDRVPEDAAISFYSVLEKKRVKHSEQYKKDAQAKALDELNDEIRSDAYSFLAKGVREIEEPRRVGFSFCLQEQEKNRLLKEAISIVKEQKLLENSLSELDKESLPLSEDEKIMMLLQSSQELPYHHHQLPAKLLLQQEDKKTGKKKNLQIPVNVIVVAGKVIDVRLIQKQRC